MLSMGLLVGTGVEVRLVSTGVVTGGLPDLHLFRVMPIEKVSGYVQTPSSSTIRLGWSTNPISFLFTLVATFSSMAWKSLYPSRFVEFQGSSYIFFNSHNPKVQSKVRLTSLSNSIWMLDITQLFHLVQLLRIGGIFSIIKILHSVPFHSELFRIGDYRLVRIESIFLGW